MSKIKVEKIGEESTPGVLITGLVRDDLKDNDIQSQLKNIWIDKGVMVFRGLSGADDHLELSRIFGTLTTHPTGNSHNKKHPEFSDITNRPDDSNVVEINGQEIGGWLPWHSDLVYFTEINRGGILRAIEPAQEGGMTGFIDQIAAYDRLPQSIKERIDGLNVVYKAEFRLEHSRYAKVDRVVRLHSVVAKTIAKQHEWPRVIHPMVFTQKETGRKVLNVSPWFAESLEGMEDNEGFGLLDEVMSYAVNEQHAYFHRWRKDDMVLWDNWRTLHCATGTDPHATRIMQRTTILGDYGLGQVAPDQSAVEPVKASNE